MTFSVITSFFNNKQDITYYYLWYCQHVWNERHWNPFPMFLLFAHCLLLLLVFLECVLLSNFLVTIISNALSVHARSQTAWPSPYTFDLNMSQDKKDSKRQKKVFSYVLNYWRREIGNDSIFLTDVRRKMLNKLLKSFYLFSTYLSSPHRKECGVLFLWFYSTENKFWLCWGFNQNTLSQKESKVAKPKSNSGFIFLSLTKFHKLQGQELLRNSHLYPACWREEGWDIIRKRKSEHRRVGDKLVQVYFPQGRLLFSDSCALSGVRYSDSWQLSVIDEKKHTHTHWGTTVWHKHTRSKRLGLVVLSWLTSDPLHTGVISFFFPSPGVELEFFARGGQGAF